METTKTEERLSHLMTFPNHEWTDTDEAQQFNAWNLLARDDDDEERPGTHRNDEGDSDDTDPNRYLG